MLASAPTIRSYPQPEFSRAILTISVSRSCPIRGRPGYWRCLEPSNLLAISLRYQARMVAGLATRATSAKALRPSRLPISASVDLSGLDKRSRGGRCARRIRFSAVKYSFWRSNSWLTRPVTYASSRSHLLSLMPSVHNTPHHPCFVFLDHTGRVASPFLPNEPWTLNPGKRIERHLF